ncbi:MAG: AI-2E family transporter [Chloroflexota bacterium]
MQPPRAPWSPSTRLIVMLLLLALAVFLLVQFKAVIIPFILALILAYVLTPLSNRMQARLGLRRGPASLLAYLAMLLVIGLLPLILVPALVNQSSQLNRGFQDILRQVEDLAGDSYTLGGQTFNPQDLLEQAAGSLGGLIEPFFGGTLNLVVEAISSLVWVIFILVVGFYLLKDGPALQAWLEDLFPPAYQADYRRLRGDIAEIWAAFFRGQLTLALVVAVIFTAAGFLLGLPFALALGMLAGLLEFLPSIGHGIWLAIAVLLALFAGSTWLPLPNWAFALLISALHVFYQQFDLNYLIPRMIGRRVHLPPLVVILGIVSGALLGGVLGVVLAAPSIASLRVIGRYIYAGLLGVDPFPSPVSDRLPPPNARWWHKPPPAVQPTGAAEPVSDISLPTERL